MDRQSKKIFSVIIAILVGVGIIFFALRIGSESNSVDTPTKKDVWENTLSVVSNIPTLKTSNASWGEWETGRATTTTDSIAQELLKNYVVAQSRMSTTTMSDAEALTIAQTLAGKIELPPAKQFTKKDVIVSKDNSADAVALYFRTIAGLTQAFTASQTKSDIEVALAIPEANTDTKRSAEIAQNIAHYEKLIKGLLAVKTPSALAGPHLHLVQKYTNIEACIRPLSDIFADPLKGLVALTEYKKEVAGFNSLAEEFDYYTSKNQQ